MSGLWGSDIISISMVITQESIVLVMGIGVSNDEVKEYEFKE